MVNCLGFAYESIVLCMKSVIELFEPSRLQITNSIILLQFYFRIPTMIDNQISTELYFVWITFCVQAYYRIEVQQYCRYMHKQTKSGSSQVIYGYQEKQDVNRLKGVIQKLQFTLQLRNKQVQYLNSQMTTFKQESIQKTVYLQNQIIQLKKQCADTKYDAVKFKRVQSQKCQKTIAALKKKFDGVLIQKDQDHRTVCDQIRAQCRQQVKEIKQKQLQFSDLDINQNYQKIRQSHNKNNDHLTELIKSLQQEKVSMLKAKKDANKQIQDYSRELQALKLCFQKYKEENSQEMILKNAEIQGLKLQQKLLREKIEQFEAKQEGINCEANIKIQEYKQLNSKLTVQLEQYKLLVLKKDETISLHQQRQTSVTAVHECNHINLIKQMQRQIDLKDQEIDQLKKTMEDWSECIGFDKPVSQRLEDISTKCRNTANLNCNFVRSLKQKKRQMNKKLIFR